jgi:hypothetical protein
VGVGWTARLVTAVTLVVSVARADEPPAHVEWQRDNAVVEGGAITMAGFYWLSTISASIGAAACGGCTDHSYLFLLIPLAGPAIAAAMPAVQQLSPAWSVILVADSVAQVAAGVVALVAYLVPTKRVVVVAKPPGASWNVSPGAPGASLGLTFTLSAF